MANLPETVGDAIRSAVEWMDVGDEAINTVYAIHGQVRPDVDAGRNVQEDLLRLADWFDANPIMAQAAWPVFEGLHAERERSDHEVSAAP